MSRTFAAALIVSTAIVSFLLGRVLDEPLRTEPTPAPPPHTASASDVVSQVQDAAAEDVVAPTEDEEPDIIWRAEVFPDDPWMGASDPIVTIVVFGAYQSNRTARVMKLVTSEIERYPEDVRVVWKDFPHPSRGSGVGAARAAAAAHLLGQFWPMHARLLQIRGELCNVELLELAAEIGIDPKDFEAALARPEVEARIKADLELASRLDIFATPTLYVNGRELAGFRALRMLPTLVDRQRGRALQMVKKDVARSDVYRLLMARGRRVELDP